MFFRRKAGSKYSAVKREVNGISFSSGLERDLYMQLSLQEKAGEITIAQVQAPVLLSRAKIKYIADFKVLDNKTNEIKYIEAKGFETPEWRIKRRLWEAYGPSPLEVWKKNGKGLFLHETIIPGLED